MIFQTSMIMFHVNLPGCMLVTATSLAQLPGHFRCLSVVLTPTHNKDLGKLNIQKVEKKFQLDNLDDPSSSFFFRGKGGVEKSLYMLKVIYQKFCVSIQGFLRYLCHFMGFFVVFSPTHRDRRDRPSFGQRGALQKVHGSLGCPHHWEGLRITGCKGTWGLGSSEAKKCFL